MNLLKNLGNSSIGIVGPFSGPRACYGEILESEVAKSELKNYAEIIFCDDKADPVCSTKIAQSLAKRQVFAVIGHFNSYSALAASKIYSPFGIPLLLPASTSPNLTKIPLTFRICPNDIDQAVAINRFITPHTAQRVAIWADGSPYSLKLQDFIQKYSNLTFICPEKLQKNSILILLGAHYKVANAIIKFKNIIPDLTVICCDDCAINEFNELVREIQNIWVVTPNPDFSSCIRYAINLVISFLNIPSYDNFGKWLARPNGPFLKQQSIFSSFNVVQIS